MVIQLKEQIKYKDPELAKRIVEFIKSYKNFKSKIEWKIPRANDYKVAINIEPASIKSFLINLDIDNELKHLQNLSSSDFNKSIQILEDKIINTLQPVIAEFKKALEEEFKKVKIEELFVQPLFILKNGLSLIFYVEYDKKESYIKPIQVRCWGKPNREDSFFMSSYKKIKESLDKNISVNYYYQISFERMRDYLDADIDNIENNKVIIENNKKYLNFHTLCLQRLLQEDKYNISLSNVKQYNYGRHDIIIYITIKNIEN